MECEKCQDRGFIEKEHGLIREFCNCEKGKALRREIIGELHNEVTNDSNNRTGSDNQPTGGGDTGEPKQPQKPKAKKKARRGSR